MKIDSKRIQQITRVHLDKIEGVPDNLIEFVEQECRESFRCVITTYFGDTVQGVIYVEDLGAWLEEKDFENVSAKVCGWLQELFEFADKNKIDEIFFG